jgi:putative transposase
MIVGISLQAHPTARQKQVLSQWMGCSRFIWNAKCDTQEYLHQFAKKYLPIGTNAPIDQTFAQYKSRELSPWLFGCPSQVLRNSAVNWYNTFRNFIKGACGRPRRKKKSDSASVLLTRELFCFEKCPDGVTRLFIGTKTNNIGYLSIKNHRSYKEPNSLRIKKQRGKYSVSFCYEDRTAEGTISQEEHLSYLKNYSRAELDQITVGVDRGVTIPVQAGDTTFDFTPEQKAKKSAKEKYIKRCQRRLSNQKKGSGRRRLTKRKIGKAYGKIGNIRKDFCHKTSRKIIDDKNTKIIILEDLQTAQMTRAPKPKKDEKTGKWLQNRASSKAGLNQSILDKSWHQLETYLIYKATKAGKAWFKVSAHYTSQECADCGHTHPNNRKSQKAFCCEHCGHSDKADHNAAKVIKKRAINLILNSGTELSKRGILLDIGRGAVPKTREANATRAHSKEASKKKVEALVA